jgi:hypothetical protein
MLTVHVRIKGATGKPTPARLRITDGGGAYHAPLGRQAHFLSGAGQDVGGQVLLEGKAFAYVDGVCEVKLPAGPLTVAIDKGVEYLPVRRQLNLNAGQIALRFTIDRWTDDRPAGWFAGDTHAVAMSPHAALLEGAAEGLSVVQLLAHECPPEADRPAAVSNLLAFSGVEAALRSPECFVAVNTRNTHPILGSVSLLNCHRPIFPLRFGRPGELDHWSVSDWCDQCHRKQGLVVWPDLPRLTDEHPQGEALAALILGKIDAFEIGPASGLDGAAMRLWYRLLDCGLRPVLVGGSGKDSNAIPLGAVRTYARLPPGEEPSPAAWIEAVRGGCTFVTNGPLISLDVAGREPGNAVSIEPGQRLAIHAQTRSAAPLDCLEVLAGGAVIASATASGDRRSITVEADLECAKSAWIVARCRGEGSRFAHTNAVFVEVPGRALQPGSETTAPLLAILDRTGAWVQQDAVVETDRQRQHLLDVLESARRALTSRG